jgi:hypothetical protein
MLREPGGSRRNVGRKESGQEDKGQPIRVFLHSRLFFLVAEKNTYAQCSPATESLCGGLPLSLAA